MKKLIEVGSIPWPQFYQRLVEVAVPRPIALVSTINLDGQTNLAPFSFFNVISSNPPYLIFCPQRIGRTGEKKDSLRNVELTRQFVVSIVTEAIAEKVNACAAPFPYGISEFEQCQLTPVPAAKVKPPLVRESPVNIECELAEIHSYGEEGGAGSLVVGRILALHIDDSLLDQEGRVQADLLQAVGRMGGDMWVTTRDTFLLKRPEVPPGVVPDGG